MRFSLLVLVFVALLLVSPSLGKTDRADAADTVRVFIQLPDRFRTSDFAEVRNLGGEPRYAFIAENTISVEIPAFLLPVLERSQRFHMVRPVPQVAVAEDWLPWGVDHVNAERVWGADEDNVTGENAVDVVDGAYDGTGVKVAIIDTGIAPHPDLNVTGRVSFVDGESEATDGHGHGTHVAGTVAARDDDAGIGGTSILGVAPGAELMAVKVLSAAGGGTMDDVAAGIHWAAENGADVINMSLVCTGTSTACNDTVMQGALQAATNAGVVIVAAAGNAGAGTNTVGWPAQDSRVIAVAATDSNNARASFSSTGPAVDIAAPGVSIFSTYPGTYATMSGTSMASPHVAGAAALLVDCGYSASQVRSRLESTADDLGAASSFGHGLLDVAGAMADCGGSSPPPPGGGGGTIVEGFESGGFTSGTGWSSAWSRAGSTSYTTVTTSSSPQAGSWHVQVRANASMSRTFSLSGYGDATLTFWAKGSSWESGDGGSVQVSTNGSTWTTVASFTDGFDTNVYQQRQVSLDQWAGQGTVYLRILGQMSASTDYFYVDSINITGAGGGVSVDPTATNTPVTPTQTPTPTPTPTNTPVTPTQTPTNTPAPTNTPVTPTETPTPTQTPTPTNTPPGGGGGGYISEDFESGGFTGGASWTGNWSRGGSTSYTTVTTSSSPQAGSWHVQVRANASMTRTFSLAGYGDATLTFWAKGSSWESGDGGSLQVSTNGTNWTTVASFTDGFDNNVYQQRQVSLNQWAGQGTMYLRILGQMSASTDYFYVDSIAIAGGGGGSPPTATPTPTPPSGGGTISEDFESGGFSGGSGWAASWSRSGSTSYTTITTSSGPQAGSRHVQVRYTASMMRRFSLSGYGSATLTFWAKGYSWESGDGASVQISTNGSTWTTVASYADGFDTNVYQQRQVSLNQWAGQGTVYVRILGQMSSSADYFYVDSISISSGAGGGGSSVGGAGGDQEIDNAPEATPTLTPVPPGAEKPWYCSFWPQGQDCQ